MKFYDLDADTERAKQKFRIVSDVVKDMRKTDPTRPVCFDSNYLHNKASKRFGDDFLKTVDDGDIDDNHAYYNWYDYSVFRFFNGEFQKQFKTPGRPLISQEMSTGYPNAETGHPTRSYQLIHQNPYSLIGYEAYDWGNPASFLNTQSFITGELAETLRRTNEQASGIMHFAYMTWFRQCYDHRNIQPYPTYYAMQRAMQPVLVSAELWGRNLYAGEKLHTRIYVVNDNEEGRDLKPMSLAWSIVDETNKVLASGTEQFPAVEYYGRKYIEPNIHMPVSYTHLGPCPAATVFTENVQTLVGEVIVNVVGTSPISGILGHIGKTFQEDQISILRNHIVQSIRQTFAVICIKKHTGTRFIIGIESRNSHTYSFSIEGTYRPGTTGGSLLRGNKPIVQ